MICPNCQTPLADSARFCNRCGTAIAQPPPQPVAPPPSVPYAQPAPSPFPPPSAPARKSKLPMILAGVAGLLVVVLGVAGVAGYMIYKRFAAPLDTAAALEILPPGDAVASFDVGMFVNTTAPKLLAGSPEALAELNKELDEAKTKSGIDPRTVGHVTFSLSMPKSGSDPDFAAIVTGSFDPSSLSSSLEKGGVTTETYQGYTIYVKTQGGKKVGATLINISTLAIGSPVEMLHRVIDARSSGAAAGASADLRDVFDATRSDALLRVASRVPKEYASMATSQQGEGPWEVLSARFFFGSVDAVDGLDVELAARMEDAARATALKESLGKLRSEFKGGLGTGPDAGRYASLVDAVTITTEGADVRLRLKVPQATVTDIVRDRMK